MNKKVELLSPAGSLDSMRAAVNAGADAIYMGGTRFGARAYAENPADDELVQAIEYVHFHGRRIYITVNTLLKDAELFGQLYEYLAPLYEAGADALIIQDLGVMCAVKSWFPDWPLHASTQMTVTGAAGAIEAKAAGAKRVVPARELSLGEIEYIKAQSGLEIECFVHGALCYCYSGQCLFSSLVGGRSGNRGRCAQACRMPFYMEGSASAKGDHLLSLKDLCTLDILPQLIDAGIDSFKIEGRMKSPRYTAGVTSIYRKYIDMYQSGAEYAVDRSDIEILTELFDRGGYSRGYYHEHNGRHMVARQEKPAFRSVDEKKLAGITEAYIENDIKEPVSASACFKKGMPSQLALSCGEVSVTAYGARVQEAIKSPLCESAVRKQLEKLGNSPYFYTDLSIDMDEGIFMPLSAVNELRRSACGMLSSELTSRGKRTVSPGMKESVRLPGYDDRAAAPGHEGRTPRLSALCENEAQARALIASGCADRLYISLECLPTDRVRALADSCKSAQIECFAAMPRIIRRGGEKRLLEAISGLTGHVQGVLIRNIDELGLMQGKGLLCVADHSLYTMNRAARAYLKERGVSADTAPVELNRSELAGRGLRGSEIIVYGRLPMMVSAQCVKKTAGLCDHKEETVCIKDRTGRAFPVKNYCGYCYNTIYNSDVLWLADEPGQILELGPDLIRLDFTTETADQALSVVRAFRQALCGGPVSAPAEGHTKGHFKRGVK